MGRSSQTLVCSEFAPAAVDRQMPEFRDGKIHSETSQFSYCRFVDILPVIANNLRDEDELLRMLAVGDLFAIKALRSLRRSALRDDG